jgi:hypothetical protein
MGQFFQEPEIFQQHGASFAGCFYVLVFCDRSAGNGKQFFLLICHDYLFLRIICFLPWANPLFWDRSACFF